MLQQTILYQVNFPLGNTPKIVLPRIMIISLCCKSVHYGQVIPSTFLVLSTEFVNVFGGIIMLEYKLYFICLLFEIYIDSGREILLYF